MSEENEYERRDGRKMNKNGGYDKKLISFKTEGRTPFLR